MTYTRYCSAYKGLLPGLYDLEGQREAALSACACGEGLDNVILAGQWISPPGGLPGAGDHRQGRGTAYFMNKEQMDFRLADAGFAG